MFIVLSYHFTYQQNSAQVFKDATLFFSQNSTPNIATVIPVMDHLDEVLATNAISNNFLPSINAALLMGKRTLNRYYSKTDLSDIYWIAMSKAPSSYHLKG